MSRKNIVLVQLQVTLRLPMGAKVDIDAHGMGSHLRINGETYCPQFALDPEHGEQVLFNDKQLASIGVEIVNYVKGECYITKECYHVLESFCIRKPGRSSYYPARRNRSQVPEQEGCPGRRRHAHSSQWFH